MKFSRLKDKICRNIEVQTVEDCSTMANFFATYGLLSSIEAGDYDWRKHYQEFKRKSIEIVQNWDVRMVGKLIQIFPDSVPRNWKNKTFLVEMDDNGEWEVYPNK